MGRDAERIGRDYQTQILEAGFRRLMGEFKPDGETVCDVIGCEAPAVCRVGSSENHPSCERHARGEDHIVPLQD